MSRGAKFILDGKTPVPADLMTWAKWYETNDRRIAYDEIAGARVSTVFIGIDHRYGDDGPPLLFETMVFKNDWDEEYCQRTATWEEAEAEHAKAVEFVRQSLQ